MNTTRYVDIKQSLKEYDLNIIKPFVPTIGELDVSRGYITRFFAQKANDAAAVVYEVHSSTYSRLINNPFFSVVNLDWQIVGSEEKIKDVNGRSVKFAAKSLPAVQLYLPYLLQFRKTV